MFRELNIHKYASRSDGPPVSKLLSKLFFCLFENKNKNVPYWFEVGTAEVPHPSPPTPQIQPRFFPQFFRVVRSKDSPAPAGGGRHLLCAGPHAPSPLQRTGPPPPLEPPPAAPAPPRAGPRLCPAPAWRGVPPAVLRALLRAGPPPPDLLAELRGGLAAADLRGRSLEVCGQTRRGELVLNLDCLIRHS